MVRTFTVATKGQGLYEITREVAEVVASAQLESGICHVFVQHTSASLTIQENADPSAKRDLERWICTAVPEHQPYFTHTMEGADDMPSHIKSVLTGTSLAVPILEGELALGTWQGIYLWEHRTRGHSRSIVVHVGG